MSMYRVVNWILYVYTDLTWCAAYQQMTSKWFRLAKLKYTIDDLSWKTHYDIFNGQLDKPSEFLRRQSIFLWFFKKIKPKIYVLSYWRSILLYEN